MRILQFQTQTNPEIKMSLPTLNIQKINSYKKYSTLFHQPRTTSVYTKEVGNLFLGVSLNENTTVLNPD